MKQGDKVLFSRLMKAGVVGVAEFGFLEGTIQEISLAGELGARAMDCPPDTEIYWILSDGKLHPKFKDELIAVGGLSEQTRQYLLAKVTK